jgi:hypothetical protein
MNLNLEIQKVIDELTEQAEELKLQEDIAQAIKLANSWRDSK